MNDRNGWIAILVLTAGLVALSIFGGVQYSNTLALTENWAAQSIEVEALRRSDILQQRQLAAFAEENAALKKQFEKLRTSSEIDNLLASQKSGLDEVRDMTVKTINLFTLKGSHGQNVFLGTGAGPRAVTVTREEAPTRDTASFNTAVGANSFAQNRTGAWNAAIGTAALGSNEVGSNNLAAGANALASNNAGSANVALGSAAMYRNRTGNHNSAVGLQALYNLQSGDSNSAFGRDSLFTIIRGSWNSAFGVDSLPGLEIGEGNSAFGGEAGYTEDRTFQHRLGSFNSWFGYQSGPASLKQVSNSIAIGYRAKNTESNQTVIGNKETKEAIVFGVLKIDRLCIGTTCADAQSFASMLKARPGR